ncbi:gamma-glutamylcyclotransferase family protein [Paenibacillus aceris]|uniref:Gamma-glutamylcyclotransferase (GGCT)/AIG2-like uncharacterized protein YtfP n=1 Tax=Paenibacillus aceris TaxID=869555 RepID=A0ABS4HV03_9BACL|nr:gamma-glutamylcyclotransferase family protein [Paenibacillus aceris]MBP1962458.1 gamma-glutamylcyclotransferase (GGCT)/AIG2-like uncharacterized protein YtfP [Paenibacillus aceris]NHW37272.1 gamma-glutamylcyclotransferase [Paenibacillus aceris]
MISVFVYGTLLVGESNHSVAAPYVQSVQPGAIFGRLFDVGPYPALLLTEENRDWHVVGEWLEVNEEGLQAMDVLEGYHGPGGSNEYDRVWIRDVSGLREGWVYIYPTVEGLKVINGSSWKEYNAERNK